MLYRTAIVVFLTFAILLSPAISNAEIKPPISFDNKAASSYSFARYVPDEPNSEISFEMLSGMKEAYGEIVGQYKDAIEKKDFEKALRKAKIILSLTADKRGENSSAYSNFVLTTAGVAADAKAYGQSKNFYESAILLGNPKAYIPYARFMEREWPSGSNPRLISNLKEMSARIGNVRSMINVGWRFYRVIGTIDLKKALFWMKRASRIEGDYQGYAVNNLAVMHEEGYAFHSDKTKAIELYKMAEKLGSKWSANNLGRLYLLGDGVEKNTALAREYFQRAISRGPSETAKFFLSMMKANNYKDFVDNQHISKVMLKILIDGNDAGYEQLGWFFREQDKIEAAKWFFAGSCLGGDEGMRVENKQQLNLMYQLFLSREEFDIAKDRLTQFYQSNFKILNSKSHCRFLN